MKLIKETLRHDKEVRHLLVTLWKSNTRQPQNVLPNSGTTASIILLQQLTV